MPVCNPDVRVFEVFDADGKPLALFYARPLQARQQERRRVDGQLRRPVEAARHQAGHLQRRQLHQAGARPAGAAQLRRRDHDVPRVRPRAARHVRGADYPTLSGTNVARDFVEFPSQFNEHWALDPRCSPHYAKHYKTGQPMPQALVDKITKARTFNQGYEIGEALEAALLDMDWHSLPADAPGRTSTRSRPTALAKTASTPTRSRRATARATSCTSGATAIRRATTRICGRGCSTTTRTPGSRSTAA